MPKPPTSKDLREVTKRSVQDTRDDGRILLFVSRAADEAPAWWSPQRDVYLRGFFPTESYLCGAVYSVCARNAAYRIEFKGPESGVRKAQRLLTTADMYRGWQDFSLKISLDLATQDNGSFFEIIRPARVVGANGEAKAVKAMDDEGNLTWKAIGRNGHPVAIEGDYKILDNPNDLPIGIAHMDAARCVRTRDPMYPVIYTDRENKEHKLRWYQVMTLQDMPSADEDMNGVGFCGVTRALRLSQTLRDMTILKQEKASGRFAGRVYLTNVDTDAIQDAVDDVNEHANNINLTRYMPPVIAYTLEPNATPAVATIDMASLPEGWSEDEAMRWYIAGLAVVFGVDYGFLAPLPGNKLGTSQQAEVAERQSRGKASRLYMNQLEEKFNYMGLLPQNVWMEFGEVDHEEEMQRDIARARRAQTRAERIASAEISPQVAQQIAVDDGDLDPRYLAMLEQEDVTPEGVYDPLTGKPRTGLTMGYGKQPRRQSPNVDVVLDEGPDMTEEKAWTVSRKMKEIFEVLRK